MRAEDRLLRIADMLPRRDFFVSVRRVSEEVDYCGIDAIIDLKSLTGKNLIHVPVQVKSSFTFITDYRRKHWRCVKAGIIIVVINHTFTDIQIFSYLIRKLRKIQEEGKDFSELYEKLRLNKGQLGQD